MEDEITVRVRGIYSTAITKILLDSGLKIGDPSEKIRKRFNLGRESRPPTVTVKDSQEGTGVVVIGRPGHVEHVSKIIREALGEYVLWKAKIPLHSIVKGKVVKEHPTGYIVSLGDDLTGILREPGLKIGDELLVDVSKPPFKARATAELSLELTVIGDYTTLIRSRKKRIIVSSHIRNPIKRKELVTLGSLLDVEGWSIKWRSAAKDAPLELLMEDVKRTLKIAEDAIKRGESAPPGTVVLQGQDIQEIGFTRESKIRLDSIRGEILPTIKGHHTLKSGGRELSAVVDFAEHVMSEAPDLREKLEEAVEEYAVKSAVELGKVEIHHIPIDKGRPLKLTPGTIIESNGDKIIVKRNIRGRGLYDGLNTPREIGDYDLMEVYRGDMIIVHNYYSRNNKWKGSYININTTPELLPGTIKYYDLLVDVLAKSDGTVETIDLEDYERAKEEGIISPELAERAEKAIDRAVQLARNIVDNMK